MKRQPSNPEKFDTLELFVALSREHGYRVDIPDDLDAFQRQIGTSLKATLGNPNMLHGKRVEAMFAYVIGALGNCKYIKQEDSGIAFSRSDGFITPDYRVITNNGEILLVEVKNFHMKKLSSIYKIKRPYLQKLSAYTEMNRASLKFAIYFSRINEWVLLSPESFLQADNHIYIDLPHAMARNEMSTVGDKTIATLPPLHIEMVGELDDDRSNITADRTSTFTTLEVKMNCAGKPISNNEEKRIAFYLMRYGNWLDIEAHPVVVGNSLVSISISSAPKEITNGQGFEMIGSLSSMISCAFRELTVDDGSGVFSLDVKYDPDYFSLAIPRGFKSEVLPIWQFILQPNLEFSNDIEEIDPSA